MAAVLMSNPGLHLAVLGNPPTRRNKRKKASAKKRRAKVARRTKQRSATMAKTRRNKVRRNKGRRYASRKANGQFKKGYRRNPMRRAARRTTARRAPTRRAGRRVARRNPTIAAKGRQYLGGLTTAPSKIMNLFKGKNAVRNVLFTGGGLVGTYIAANMVRARTEGMLMSIPGMGNEMVRRVVYGLLPYTMGFFGSMLVKNAQTKAALQVGGALGSLIEIVAPGMLAAQLARLPFVGQYAGAMGLYGYVDAPAYAGSAGYVDAPAYAGSGEDVMLAGYVDAPAYAGSGQEMLAGNFIEDSSIFQPAF